MRNGLLRTVCCSVTKHAVHSDSELACHKSHSNVYTTWDIIIEVKHAPIYFEHMSWRLPTARLREKYSSVLFTHYQVQKIHTTLMDEIQVHGVYGFSELHVHVITFGITYRSTPVTYRLVASYVPGHERSICITFTSHKNSEEVLRNRQDLRSVNLTNRNTALDWVILVTNSPHAVEMTASMPKVWPKAVF